VTGLLARRPGGTDPLPLSSQQERLWLADRLDPGTSAANLPLAIDLDGPVSAAALHAALAAFVRRHEVGRTVYRVRDGRPHQVVLPFAPPSVAYVDLAGLPPAEAGRAALDLGALEARRPFDLAAGPVVRAVLLRLAASRFRLLVTRHHVASDGWSLGLLLAEVSAAYSGAAAGRPSGLDAPALQYADFAVWQRARERRAQPSPERDRWVEHVRGFPRRLPPLGPPGPGSGVAGAVRLALDRDGTAAVRAAARRERTTLFVALAAAYGAALSMASGLPDVLVGTTVAGRDHPALERVHGSFADLVPLPLRPGGARTFRRAIADAHAAHLRALTHRDLPYERLLAAVRPGGGPDPAPLFDAVITLQSAPLRRVELPGLVARVLPVEQVAAKFPLTLTATEHDAGLDLLFEYDPRAAGQAFVERLAQRFVTVLRRGAAEPSRPFADLLAPAGDRAAVPAALGRRAVPTAPELVARHVRLRGDAVAVSSGAERVTYRELDARAGALAGALRAAGAGRETLVAVRLPPSPDLVVALLGVWLAGAAYVPLDEADPPARLHAIAARAGAVALVTGAGEPAIPGLPTVAIDGAPGRAAAPPAAWHGEQLAYVIPTSGSAGAPKDVMVSHESLGRLLAAAAGTLAPAPGDVWTLAHSSAFDFSVWEIWGALASGARLAVVPPDVRRSPRELWRLVRAEGVTILCQTPTAFAPLAAVALAQGSVAATRLRLVVLGGERAEPAGLRDWLAATGDGPPRLVNMYGITETCVHVTHRTLGPADAAGGPSSPIGRPLPGATLRAVDAHGASVDVGGRGELVVGGGGVARGYRHQPRLTADRFRPDGRVAGARAYHSGDVAEVLERGEFAYVGRRDEQIKLRGFRIEPAEVEAALAGLPHVRAAAVAVRELGSRAVLTAYVVPSSAAIPGEEELRRALADRLPRHMVPGAFVTVDELPLNRNGKLDRDALPAPAPRSRRAPAHDAPRSTTERLLAGLLGELLGIEGIGVHDDFFELGADSLVITQLHARVVERLGVDLPMRRVYGALDVASLAVAIDTLRAEIEQDGLRALLDEVEALSEEDVRRRLG
jgi:nonribosomal peptide synthetase protein BlmVII